MISSCPSRWTAGCWSGSAVLNIQFDASAAVNEDWGGGFLYQYNVQLTYTGNSTSQETQSLDGMNAGSIALMNFTGSLHRNRGARDPERTTQNTPEKRLSANPKDRFWLVSNLLGE